MYPNVANEKKTLNNALCHVSESRECQPFVEMLRRERHKLREQLETAPLEISQILQGQAQAFSLLIRQIDGAREARKKISKFL